MIEPTVRVSTPELQNLIVAALIGVRMTPDNAVPVAYSLAACERDGVKTHGILRIDGFIDLLKSQSENGVCHPELVHKAGSVLSVNAHGGFAQVALASFRDEAMTTARGTGVAVMTIGNAYHSAAIWPDIELIAAEGFIVFSCVNSRQRMAVSAIRRQDPVVSDVSAATNPTRTGINPM